MWHFLVLEPGRHHAEVRRDNRVNAVVYHVGRWAGFHAEKVGRSGDELLQLPKDGCFPGDHLAKRLPLLEVGGALNVQYRAGFGVADRERNRLAGGIAGNRRDVDRHNRLSALGKRSRAGQTKRQHGERSVKSLYHNPRPGSVTAGRLHGHLFRAPPCLGRLSQSSALWPILIAISRAASSVARAARELPRTGSSFGLFSQ